MLEAVHVITIEIDMCLRLRGGTMPGMSDDGHPLVAVVVQDEWTLITVRASSGQVRIRDSAKDPKRR